MAKPRENRGKPVFRAPALRRSALKKILFRAFLSLSVGGLFAYLAFRDLDWEGLVKSLRGADYRWLIPYFGTLVGVHVVRAWRWKYLLQPVAPEMPSNWRIISVSWVGFTAILALPLRLGEVVRPYLIADPRKKDSRCDDDATDGNRESDDRGRLRMSAALGTIAVERVVDGLIVSIFLFTVFFILDSRGQGTSWMMPLGWTALGVFGGSMLFLAAAVLNPAWSVSVFMKLSLLDFLAGRFGGKAEWLRNKVAYGLEGVIQGFLALKSPLLLIKFVIASMVYWGFNGLGFWILSRAFHLGLDITGGYAVCGLVVIGITLPTAPGLVGNFHEFARLGLLLYLPTAVVRADGMAYVVAVHMLQVTWYVGMGVLMLVTGQVSFGKVVEAAKEHMDTMIDD